MAGERAVDYLWALRHTKRLFSELLVVPKTFVTDRELTLMNTLSTVYVDDDNVKFSTTEFVWMALEIESKRAHFFGIDTLIGDALIVQVDHALTDVYTKDGFAVRCEVHRHET